MHFSCHPDFGRLVGMHTGFLAATEPNKINRLSKFVHQLKKRQFCRFITSWIPPYLQKPLQGCGQTVPN